MNSDFANQSRLSCLSRSGSKMMVKLRLSATFFLDGSANICLLRLMSFHPVFFSLGSRSMFQGFLGETLEFSGLQASVWVIELPSPGSTHRRERL